MSSNTKAEITKEIIESQIKTVDYYSDSKSSIIFCFIRMKSGWVQDGSSACINIEVYNVEKGRELAYQDAFNKLYRLEGYLAVSMGWDDYSKLRKI
jgi:hypothetical protein